LLKAGQMVTMSKVECNKHFGIVLPMKATSHAFCVLKNMTLDDIAAIINRRIR